MARYMIIVNGYFIIQKTTTRNKPLHLNMGLSSQTERYYGPTLRLSRWVEKRKWPPCPRTEALVIGYWQGWPIYWYYTDIVIWVRYGIDFWYRFWYRKVMKEILITFHLSNLSFTQEYTKIGFTMWLFCTTYLLIKWLANMLYRDIYRYWHIQWPISGCMFCPYRPALECILQISSLPYSIFTISNINML